MKDINESELENEIATALNYYNSDVRKDYSNQRIDNGVGDLSTAMAAGIKILTKNGRSLLIDKN